MKELELWTRAKLRRVPSAFNFPMNFLQVACLLFETENTPERGRDMGPAKTRLVAWHLHGPSLARPTLYAVAGLIKTCPPPALVLNINRSPTACKMVSNCGQEPHSMPSWSAPTASITTALATLWLCLDFFFFFYQCLTDRGPKYRDAVAEIPFHLPPEP